MNEDKDPNKEGTDKTEEVLNVKKKLTTDQETDKALQPENLANSESADGNESGQENGKVEVPETEVDTDESVQDDQKEVSNTDIEPISAELEQADTNLAVESAFKDSEKDLPSEKEKPGDSGITAENASNNIADNTVQVEGKTLTKQEAKVDKVEDDTLASDSEDEDSEVEEDEDYTHLSIDEILKLSKQMLEQENIRKADTTMRKLREEVNNLYSTEKSEALAKYKTQNNDSEEGFEFRRSLQIETFFQYFKEHN
ncbi:MAG: hypothetical protein AAGI07_18015, partial [Bacteroidota bacterium]